MAKIVAVTSCPTGIAHTYMAAEMLEKAGRELGVKVIVETNGAIGVENRLKESDIAESVAVIVAADATVQMKRFNGKPLIECGVSYAIKNAKKLVQDALDGLYPVYQKQ
ncbi:MAG: PTS fructose transporter subunit IIB [Candidatus Izemoplasmatales bacterium]